MEPPYRGAGEYYGCCNPVLLGVIVTIVMGERHVFGRTHEGDGHILQR